MSDFSERLSSTSRTGYGTAVRYGKGRSVHDGFMVWMGFADLYISVGVDVDAGGAVVVVVADVASVDDTALDIMFDDSIWFDEAASVVVAHEVLVRCELVGLVPGAVDKAVEDEDAVAEVVLSLVVEVCAVLAVNVACCVVDVSVVVSVVASGVVVSDAEVIVEL